MHGYEVDFFWPEHGLVMELDGYDFHSSRAAFERDRVKQAKLLAAGVPVLRVTGRQIRFEPYALIAHIAQALARASVA